MSRTKRIYNLKPEKVFHNWTVQYYDNKLKYKQICMGHCKYCKPNLLQILKKKHVAFLKDIELCIVSWI